MQLFQTPARTPEEIERSKPLSIPPDKVLEFDEDEWYAKVYRGEGVPQLTVRAVLMGSVLGFAMAFTNLYVGLKSGWALGVAITACILSYSIWTAFLRARIARSPMSILEMNCMQSTASSAGYSTGGIMVSAMAALLLLSIDDAHPKGQHLRLPVLILWTIFLAVLGTCLAIPMKRNMINRERLKFPSGTAAAVTLQSLYSEGEEALAKAKAMFWTMGVTAIFPLLIELQIRVKTVTDAATGAVEKVRSTILPDSTAVFDMIGLPARGVHYKVDTDAGERLSGPIANLPSNWTMVWDNNPVMIGAGMLVGLRVSFWMLVSALLLAYVFGPLGFEHEYIDGKGRLTTASGFVPEDAWRNIGIWIGAPIMVASGLVAFLMNWKTIVRAFAGFAGSREGTAIDRSDVEVPASWFLAGALVGGGGTVWIAATEFGVAPYLGLLAVAMTFALSLVACRATGESDITPTGAMGKVMQLTYGVLIPQNASANLMTAGITASAAGSSADLLNDLKSGYLLGANPRRQFLAQFLGIFAGTAATVIGFRYLFLADATRMTDGTFPAPSAAAWKAVADVFSSGLESMPSPWRDGILWGGLTGTLFVLLEAFLPRYRKWLPSATGLGLGFILPFQYPLSMFVGALFLHLWQKGWPRSSKRFGVIIASGIIAGYTLMAVVVTLVNRLLVDVVDRL